MFIAPVDIANRALQHCGQPLIDRTLGFAEQSAGARQISSVYDGLRRAELQRNTWRFAIREAVLRPVDTTTMLLTPALWVSTATYFVGSIVSDENGRAWQSITASNLDQDPATSSTWVPYFGPLTVTPYDSTVAYFTGELVYTAAGDGTSRVYLSLLSSNTDNPATATAWSATTTYQQNQVVTYSSIAYMSLVDLNLNQTPLTSPSAWTTSFVGGSGSVQWLQIGGAEFPNGVGLATMRQPYPLGAGPSSQSDTRNVFRLPAGYLMKAPQDPKAGSSSYLGAPSGLYYDDWRYEGDWLVSRDVGAIVFRFVADVQDVTKMTDMFCEGLGARIGLSVCEKLTQSSDKVKTIGSLYDRFMRDARQKNAIEVGSEEPAEDDWIACRL